MNPLQEFPHIRKVLYRIHWVAVGVLACVGAFVGAVPDLSLPFWFPGVVAVVGIVGGLLSATADTNVVYPDVDSEGLPHWSASKEEEV